MSNEVLELQDLPTGYLSDTQINMFVRCPQQYYYRYIKKMKMPPSFSLVLGSSVHETLHTNFEIKIQQGKDLLEDEFIDCFETKLVEETNKYGEIDYGDDIPDKVKDTMILPLKQFHLERLPVLFPKLIEQEYIIKLSTGLVIKSVLDYIDDRQIIDFKTAKNKTSMKFKDGTPKIIKPSNQLILYSSVQPDKRVSIIKFPRSSNCESFEWDISQDKRNELLNEYTEISKVIRTGIVYRNPGTNEMNCSWCGYKDICRKVL